MRITLQLQALVLGLATASTLCTPALAQSTGSAGIAPFQSGYGASRYTTARSASGSTRDANGNRLIVNGIIQSGASSYSSRQSGVASSASSSGQNGNGIGSIGGATAIGNNLNVVVQGNNNTVVVNSTQTNTGKVTAGTVLNGSLVFP